MTPEELRAELDPLKDRLREFQSIIGLSAQGWRLMEDTIETLDLLDAANAETEKARAALLTVMGQRDTANAEVARLRGIIARVQGVIQREGLAIDYNGQHTNRVINGYQLAMKLLAILDQSGEG